MADHLPPGPDVPPKMRTPRKIGRRKPLTPQAADAQEAMFTRASDADGTHGQPGTFARVTQPSV